MNTFSIYQVDKDAPTYDLQEEISIEPGDDPYSQRIIYSIHEFMIYFLAYKYHAESWGKTNTISLLESTEFWFITVKKRMFTNMD